MFTRFPLLFGMGVVLLISGCARPYGGALLDTAPLRDASLEELRLLYQKEQEAFPPMKGLMEITLQAKREKIRFWAKWKSNADGITINGFNLIGGSLFDFETTRTHEVHFKTADSKRAFHGSREAFQQYLMANSKMPKNPLRMEWLAMMDWMARGGIPDLPHAHPTTLEKQKDRFILYTSSKGDGENKTFLARKLFVERRGFRVTHAFLFDPEGALEMQIRFSDYRPVYGRPSESIGHLTSMADTSVAARFPFHIQIEAGDFYGDVAFMELYADGAE